MTSPKSHVGNGVYLANFAETFELFLEKPRTARELSELTGKKPDGVYRHIAALLKAGLVEEVPAGKLNGKGRVGAVYQLVRKPRRVPEAAVDEVLRFADEYRRINGALEGAALSARERLRTKLVSLYEDS